MPLLHYVSTLRAQGEDSTLSLDITHCLRIGAVSDIEAACIIKKPPPPFVDVHCLGDLSISVRIKKNGQDLVRKDDVRSAIIKHFVLTIRENAMLLGINDISDAYMDACDDELRVDVKPQRSKPAARSELAAMALNSISLSLSWKDGRSGLDPAALCNLETMLNRIWDKFLSHHLIRRYPLIFGPWGEKSEVEKKFFPVIARCLMSMTSRSDNPEFKQQVGRQLRLLRKGLERRHDALSSLQLDSLEHGGSSGDHEDLNVTFLCTALQGLWKTNIRLPAVKFVFITDFLPKQINGAVIDSDVLHNASAPRTADMSRFAAHELFVEHDLDLDFGNENAREEGLRSFKTDHLSCLTEISTIGNVCKPVEVLGGEHTCISDQSSQTLDSGTAYEDDLIDSSDAEASQICSDYAGSDLGSSFSLSSDEHDNTECAPHISITVTVGPASSFEPSTTLVYGFTGSSTCLSDSDLGFTSGEESSQYRAQSARVFDNFITATRSTMVYPSRIASETELANRSTHTLDWADGSEGEADVGFGHCTGGGSGDNACDCLPNLQCEHLAPGAMASCGSHNHTTRTSGLLCTRSPEGESCSSQPISFRPAPKLATDNLELSSDEGLESSEDEIEATRRRAELKLLETDSDSDSAWDWM